MPQLVMTGQEIATAGYALVSDPSIRLRIFERWSGGSLQDEFIWDSRDGLVWNLTRRIAEGGEDALAILSERLDTRDEFNALISALTPPLLPAQAMALRRPRPHGLRPPQARVAP